MFVCLSISRGISILNVGHVVLTAESDHVLTAMLSAVLTDLGRHYENACQLYREHQVLHESIKAGSGPLLICGNSFIRHSALYDFSSRNVL